MPDSCRSDSERGIAQAIFFAVGARARISFCMLSSHRFWLAEHYNMPGIASAATAVVIGHATAATKIMRIEAEDIMLFNQAPSVIAKQFGTLATIFPARVCPSLGFPSKERSPTIQPSSMVASTPTLVPDSYRTRALPFDLQSISGHPAVCSAQSTGKAMIRQTGYSGTQSQQAACQGLGGQFGR